MSREVICISLLISRKRHQTCGRRRDRVVGNAIGHNRRRAREGVKAIPRKSREIVLDFNATEDPLHGAQEGGFFHRYYRSYCYLPLSALRAKNLRPWHHVHPFAASAQIKCEQCGLIPPSSASSLLMLSPSRHYTGSRIEDSPC